MGRDPNNSVTNSFCQTHVVKNRYVVDGCVFVSAKLSEPDLNDSRP